MTVGSLFSGIGGLELGLERATGARVVWQVERDGYCRHVLARHWPDAVRHDDVRTVGAHNLAPVDILCGGFPCFAAGTLILTRDGLVPIERVVVGDEVWTHESRWRRVTATMRREATTTLRLTGGLHPGIQTTDEHPFWSSAGRGRVYVPHRERRRGNWHTTELAAPEWVDAARMVGRFWATPILDGDGSPPAVARIPQSDGTGPGALGLTVTPEVMWVLGAWVGDGWARRRADRGGGVGSMIICTPNSGMEELQRRLTEAGLHATVSPGRTCNKLIISKRALAVFAVDHFGEKAGGKRLPGWLYFVREEYRRAFLDGYLWADGSALSGGGWRTTSICRELTFGIALLGTSLGMTCSIHLTRRPARCVIEGRTCNQRDTWSVVGRFRRKQTSSFVIGDHSFSKCRREEASGPATVYNLSVEEDESYVADGLVVHNCQDLSAAGKGAGFGTEDAPTRSGLWFEFRRIIHELRPAWVVGENVGHTWRRWVPVVRRSLWELGYASVPIRVRACDLGARHERARVFIVAAADAPSFGWGAGRSGRFLDSAGWSEHPDGPATHHARLRLEEREHLGGDGDEQFPPAAGGADDGEGRVSPGWGLAPRPWMVRGVHGLPGGVDGAWARAGWTGARLRTARIHALGNSVVPACAEVVGGLIAACNAPMTELHSPHDPVRARPPSGPEHR